MGILDRGAHILLAISYYDILSSMFSERPISIVHSRPIRMPEFIDGIGSNGYMALTTVNGIDVLGRGIPENTIFSGKLSQFGNSLQLNVDNNPILTQRNKPLTEIGKDVLGYEDPTLISAQNNPFSLSKEGILATQVYPA